MEEDMIDAPLRLKPDDSPSPAERSFRQPGCGDGCHVVRAIVAGVFGRSELLLHDPADHELYGALSAMQAGGALVSMNTVETGPLRVNVVNREAYLAGELLNLTPTEAAILTLLARNLGHLVSHDDIVRSVWAWRSDGRPANGDDLHVLRCNVSRLRARLGPRAAGLIVTRPGAGLFLDAVPPGGSARPRLSRIGARWAKFWDACRSCGGTAYGHAGRGYCHRGGCYTAYLRTLNSVRHRQDGAS